MSGDFTLALWEWDIRITSESETYDVQTGRRPTADPADTGAIEEWTQAFLHATNATLTVTLGPKDVLVVKDLTASVEGSIRVREPQGQLEIAGREVAVDGDSLYASGSFAIASKARGDRLAVALDGSFDEVRFDGASILAREPPATPFWAWLLAGVLAPFLASTVWMWIWPRRAFRRALGGDKVPWSTRPVTPREERAAGWFALGIQALADERLSWAWLYAMQAVRTAPHIPDHRWLRVKVQRARQRPAKTLNDLERLCSMLRPGAGRGRAAYEFAMTLAALRHDDEAAQWMDVARREYPEGYRSVIHLPELAAVRSRLMRVSASPDVA